LKDIDGKAYVVCYIAGLYSATEKVYVMEPGSPDRCTFRRSKLLNKSYCLIYS